MTVLRAISYPKVSPMRGSILLSQTPAISQRYPPPGRAGLNATLDLHRRKRRKRHDRRYPNYNPYRTGLVWLIRIKRAEKMLHDSGRVDRPSYRRSGEFDA